MSSKSLHTDDPRDPDQFGTGMTGAVGLHLLLAAGLVASMYLGHHSADRWGENQSSVGAIQASMVSAIPLPSHAKPVEKQVLASEDENQAPLPPPKEATQPPPRPTDVLIRAKTPPPAKPAPVHSQAPPKVQPNSRPTEAPPVKHPQPAPPTPKAQTGETTATQLPEAISQLKNGTATVSTPDRAFGFRYAYYLRGVSQRVSQNWVASEADARTSQGHRVTLLFDIDRDGNPLNVHVENRSGSPTLDQSAMRAVQRVDGFGPLPAGNQITIEFSFDYRAQ
ncbi:MAG: TonB family protein [Janthinobacterium lividum]